MVRVSHSTRLQKLLITKALAFAGCSFTYYVMALSMTIANATRSSRRPNSCSRILGDQTMEILETRTLRGPNYWSGYWKKLIIMRLDIGEYEQRPTNKIDCFPERMKTVLPTLVSHGCSYQEEGGFLRRVEEGT